MADSLVRYGIRRWLRARSGHPDLARSTPELVALMRAGAMAPPAGRWLDAGKELPATFFEQVLGPHLMTSCCYWPTSIDTLADAEAAMLNLTCERADIADGQRVLQLGCGWGALALWIARRYPATRVVAVSPSHTHRAFIETRRLTNVEVVTADVGAFATGRRFDRVVLVEALERLWNWERLLSSIASWLEPDGKLFLQLTCHARHTYPLADEDIPSGISGAREAWIMPSADLIDQFQNDLSVETRWRLGGEHYARTAEAWRVQLEARRAWIVPILADVHGVRAATRWYRRWRIRFLACAELFGFGGGSEWGIAHYRLAKA